MEVPKSITKVKMKKFICKITRFTTRIKGDDNEYFADIECETERTAAITEEKARQAGFVTKRLERYSGGAYIRISNK